MTDEFTLQGRITKASIKAGLNGEGELVKLVSFETAIPIMRGDLASAILSSLGGVAGEEVIMKVAPVQVKLLSEEALAAAKALVPRDGSGISSVTLTAGDDSVTLRRPAKKNGRALRRALRRPGGRST